MLRKNDLHCYQMKAVEHIKDVQNSALFLDMGLRPWKNSININSD